MTTIVHNAENTSRTLLLDGLKIHYHEADGGQETLVLLHGGGPGASAWSNFQENLPELAESFRVLAIDMPHFGKSDKPRENYLDAEWYAEVLAGVLGKLGIPKAHFVGNSLGGAIALHLAIAKPELVDRLVLMGTGGSLPMFSPLPTEGAKHLIEYYHGDGPTKAKLEGFIRSMIFDQSRITPEFINERYEASIAPELLIQREMKKLDTMFTLWRRVDQVPHKTLLVYGRDDRVVPWDTCLLLLRLMPNADLHVFARSGHWAQWERAPEFNSVVANFLNGPST
ncbi:MAG: alpha/beta fold hydrolase [Rhodobiaceae bacterium]|nr:alpha/beta fold hydrolase [Rhodobiaceae bacterium]